MNPPIDISEEAGVRYLHFGSDWIQGAMRIRKPYALELAYTREMMAGLLLRDGLAADGGHWPRKVLIIGLGAASLARFVHHHLPQARIRVVEIAPAVVAAARQFFKLPTEDARFSVHLAAAPSSCSSTTRPGTTCWSMASTAMRAPACSTPSPSTRPCVRACRRAASWR